jgi:hypothetical protein
MNDRVYIVLIHSTEAFDLDREVILVRLSDTIVQVHDGAMIDDTSFKAVFGRLEKQHALLSGRGWGETHDRSSSIYIRRVSSEQLLV